MPNIGLGLFLSSNFVRPALNPGSDLPTLVAWFDMLDPASYTQAGTVTSINNKKSGVAWAEASVPPNYAANGLGTGKPSMGFAGTQRIISTEAAVVAAMQGGTAYTLYAVGNVGTADAAMAFFGAGSSANATNANRFFGNNITGSGVWINACRSDGGSSVNVESSATPVTTPVIYETWCDLTGGAKTTTRINGAAVGAEAVAQVTGTCSPNRCAIGARPASTPNVLLTGNVGEILLCTSVLTDAERSAVRQYLGARWNIATV